MPRPKKTPIIDITPETLPAKPQGELVINYGVTDADIKTLKEQAAKVLMDWKVGGDLAPIKKERNAIRDIRTEIDPYRLRMTAKARQYQDDVNAEGKRIKEALVAIETPLTDIIAAEDKRIADEKEAKRVAEEQRVKSINDRIDGFYNYCHESIGKPVEEISKYIDILVDLETSDPFNYGEFLADATRAKDEAFTKLIQMRTDRRKLDEANAILAKQAEEARLAAEAEKKRLAEEAEKKRLEQIEEDKRLAADRKKLADETAAFEAKKKAFEDAQAAAAPPPPAPVKVVDLNPADVAQANIETAKTPLIPEMKYPVILTKLSKDAVMLPAQFGNITEMAKHLNNILLILPMASPPEADSSGCTDYEAGYNDGQRALIETLLKHMR